MKTGRKNSFAAALLLPLLLVGAGAQTPFGLNETEAGREIPQSAVARVVTQNGREIELYFEDFDSDGRPDILYRFVGSQIFRSFRGPAFLLWLRERKLSRPLIVEGGSELDDDTVGEFIISGDGGFIFRPAPQEAVGGIRRQFTAGDALFQELRPASEDDRRAGRQRR